MNVNIMTERSAMPEAPTDRSLALNVVSLGAYKEPFEKVVSETPLSVSAPEFSMHARPLI